MPRKTGEEVKIEVEVGTTYYAFAALSTVSSPDADVGRIFTTSATYMSDQKNLQPDVRLDGVISGLNLSPGSGSDWNTVEVSAGSVYIKGEEVEITATQVTDIERPLMSGNVRITALTVDADGNVNGTDGAEGTAGTVRGTDGGKPFLPVDQVLIGYVTLSPYGSSVSGQRLITAAEIDNESKERSNVPSYIVHYHDGDGGRDNATNLGAFEFYTALPEIHAVTAGGPGTARRNVYAAYYDAEFEELGDIYDFDFTEDIATVVSRAYGDLADETTPTVPSWSGSGSAYWTRVKDILNLIKNSKRWIKYYPDDDETPHWVGRAIITVGRAMPVAGNMTASVTLAGSGRLYDKQS